MNCTCINEIQNSIPIDQTFKGKRIEKAEVPFSFSRTEKADGSKELTTVSYTDIILTVEGLKNPKTMALVHTFCPFCGTKI